MNIKLYRQKKKIPAFGTGKKIYQGEDSHPYADSEVLIVADGLGGRGGFPHTKIDHRILDKDEIYGVLFANVFTAEVSEEFKDFVVNNFSELFETKEYYWDSDDTQRRSGYFASRIVTAIALYEVKYNPDFSRATVFEGFDAKTDDEKDELALSLGKRLGELILEKLKAIAELGGFEMEVSNKGAYLLPSTLTVALMNEREDAVDVLYLWAGDSRGYIWSVEGGMAQVTEDHEQDETMTNLITLSRPFTVEGRFLTVQKPCAIFNASDGVYKPPSFACPIDQEYVFLIAVDKYDNEAEAMAYLEREYNNYSPDDSSTLALYGAGYESYEAFREAVRERMAVVDREYKSKLPGIFDCDYAGDLARLLSEIPNSFAEEEIAQKILSVPEIAKIVTNDMVVRKYAPYFEAAGGEDNEIREFNERKNQKKAQIERYVKSNWCTWDCVKKYIPEVRNDNIPEYDCSENGRIDEEISKRPNKESRNNFVGALTASFATLTKFFRNSENFDILYSDEPLDELYAPQVKELKESVLKVVDGEIEWYLAQRNKQRKTNSESLAKDALIFEKLMSDLFAASDINEIEWYNGKKPERLAALHSEYIELCRNAPQKISEGDDGDKEILIRYWCGNKRLHGLIWNQYRELIPSEVIDGILARTEGNLEKRDAYVAALEKREKLYAAYNERYFRQYRPARI